MCGLTAPSSPPQGLMRVDSLHPVSLGLLLRSLAAARVHSPRLLTAAEPYLVDGIRAMSPKVRGGGTVWECSMGGMRMRGGGKA